MDLNKNEKAWKSIFEKYNILKNIIKHGAFIISSKQINEFREARLMTKFDYRSQLPDIFKENKLSILPISRGSYIIGNFEIFSDFTNEESELINIGFPEFIKSIDFRDIRSEAIALNCAYISGMLTHFTNEEQLLPTVSGRMGSSDFSFNVKNKEGALTQINVNNAQVEIDGGYEGRESLILIEAKNIITEDFLVRQLYYPYRVFLNKLNKPVRPVFVTYSNGIFNFREYYFEDFQDYNSIRLLKFSRYSIIESTLTIDLLMSLISQTPIIEENQEIPFPQADDLARIINLCELINECGGKSKDEISEEYGFVPRQADYYSNAAIYLGLLEKDEKDPRRILMSDKGRAIFKLNLPQRQIELIKHIIEHYPFRETLNAYLHTGFLPTKNEVVRFMQSTPHINIESISTFHRRAQSVISWINWIVSLIKK